MNTSQQMNKTVINLIKTSAIAISVTAGIGSITPHPWLELEPKRVAA